MNWKDHIISDKDVLIGKPTIVGTRISVAHISQLLWLFHISFFCMDVNRLFTFVGIEKKSPTIKI